VRYYVIAVSPGKAKVPKGTLANLLDEGEEDGPRGGLSATTTPDEVEI
jgi:hypothetical protein